MRSPHLLFAAVLPIGPAPDADTTHMRNSQRSP